MSAIAKLTRPRFRFACVGSLLVRATACGTRPVPSHARRQPSSAQAAAPEDPVVGRLTGELTDAGAMTHLQALQKIADEHGGNRAARSPG